MFFIRNNRWKVKSDQNWSKGEETFTVSPQQVFTLRVYASIEHIINAFTCQIGFFKWNKKHNLLCCNLRVHVFIITSMQQPRAEIHLMLWYTFPNLSRVKQTHRESIEAPMNEPEETSHITTLHIRALIEQHQVKVIHVQIFSTYF